MKKKAGKRKTGRGRARAYSGVQGKNHFRKVHRQVKDRLFRFLFEKDREALLSLYNALNGTDYTDAGALQVVTIESVVYIVMKNDLAFVLAGVLNLYEHQSTRNPNLPVRFLIYLAQEYQKLIETVDISLYGTRQLTLPTPQCVVFYNGDENAPEEEFLHLSDAFEDRSRDADVDLRVRVLNINQGHNRELMEKCRILREYAEFVAVTKAYTAETSDRKAALSHAIDDCIEKNVLADFLRTYRAEVLGMLLEEFDAKKYERSIREEGIALGREEGIVLGREEGLVLGREEGLVLGREEGLVLGRTEGIALGMESGEYKKLVFIISRMKTKGCTAEETAAMLEEDLELITKVYNALENCDADTEWEKIVELL